MTVWICLGLMSPPSPSSFQKSATMLNHQHKQTFWKSWKEDDAIGDPIKEIMTFVFFIYKFFELSFIICFWTHVVRGLEKEF